MGAMAEEIDEVKTLMKGTTVREIGGRTFCCGDINGMDCVVVFSKWGKVAASITATILLQEFAVTQLVFIGTAGALADNLKVGDIVVAKRLVQHDLDARPIIKRFELPLLNRIYVDTDANLTAIALQSIASLLDKGVNMVIGDKNAWDFGITKPALVSGDIASGDQFVNDEVKRQSIINELPDIQCVEMEGAAVAQACFEFKIPFSVIRIISDTADHNARVDFGKFVIEVANAYSKAIINVMTQRLAAI